MNEKDYWKECIALAADDCNLTLTNDQLENLASSAQGAHENYGMAFYSPPPTDRISSIENEWKQKLSVLKKEFDDYRSKAEGVIKKVLHQDTDAIISIEKNGDVFVHGGRTDRIL